MTNANDEPASAKEVARAFGMLKPEGSLDDLEAKKTGEVTGGAILGSKADTDAHGCPACPHPAGFVVTKTTLPR